MTTNVRLLTNTILPSKKFPELQGRFRALNTDIETLCGYESTVGLSIGVLNQNETIWYSNFGVKSLEGGRNTDESTVYHIASVGKFIASYAIGILVKQKNLNWNDPVKKYLPDFRQKDKYTEKMTVLDCVTHQTGLAAQNRLWLAERGRIAFAPDQLFDCVEGLKVREKPGMKWRYNNWGYALAGRLTAQVSGQTWGEFLNDNVFAPLSMNNTSTDYLRMNENTASGY